MPFKNMTRQVRALFVTTLAALLFASAANADPYMLNKEGNLILDKATGLVWMRCSLGQRWDGTTCAGVASKENVDSAETAARKLNKEAYAGATDWVVPEIKQLAFLRLCSNRLVGDASNVDQLRVPRRCGEGSTTPSIDKGAFPNTVVGRYWSSTIYVGHYNGGNGWTVNFNDGDVDYNHRDRGSYYVRLVRANQVLDGESVLGFNRQAPTNAEFEADAVAAKTRRNEEAAAAKVKRDAEETTAKLKRDAEEAASARKAQAAKAAAIRSLIAQGSQSVYLQAGKAQRSGGIDVSGVSFSADDLYELIVDKFPNSEYAVKATDQLNAMDRSQRQTNATRDAAAASERAANAQLDADRNSSNRAACFSQVRSCEAGCSRNDTIGSRNYCINGCQRTCN
jgi:hypothetical protein